MSIEFGNSVSEAYLGSTTEFSYHPDSHCSKPSRLKIKKREILSKHTPQSANHKLKTLMSWKELSLNPGLKQKFFSHLRVI